MRDFPVSRSQAAHCARKRVSPTYGALLMGAVLWFSGSGASAAEATTPPVAANSEPAAAVPAERKPGGPTSVRPPEAPLTPFELQARGKSTGETAPPAPPKPEEKAVAETSTPSSPAPSKPAPPQPAAKNPVKKPAVKKASPKPKAESLPENLRLPATGSAPAIDPLYERQLAAIRQAILDVAIGAPTRVQSTAWVDSNGVLHEATQYTTDAQVRGVRVKPYQREMTGETAFQVDADLVLPKGWRLDPKQMDSCTPERIAHQAKWRMPLAYTVKLDPSLHEQPAAVGRWLSEQIRQLLARQDPLTQRWILHPQAAAADDSNAPYWSALLGKSTVDADWQLTVYLNQAPLDTTYVAPKVPFDPGALWRLAQGDAAYPPIWQIHWTLQRAGDNTPVWQNRAQLALPHNRETFAGSEALNALRTSLQTGIAQLDAPMRCEPTHFKAQSDRNGEWSLSVGASSGLHLGDRMLILDRQQLPRRLLEPGAINRLALAEVTAVTATRIHLRPLAGPPLPPAGDWVALPL